MYCLESIKKMNCDAVKRQRRNAEQETTRLSSFSGEPYSGLILHSAKNRSTVFLLGAAARAFLADYSKAKGKLAKNAVIESYFQE